jgi:WD40 repeat protein
MSKLSKIFLIIFVILGASLVGCAQLGTEQPVVEASATLPLTTGPTQSLSPVATVTELMATGPVKPTLVEATPILQSNITISVENAAKLEMANTINFSGATDFRWCENGLSLCVTLPAEVVVYSLDAKMTTNRITASNPKLLSVAPNGDMLAWVENDSQIQIWGLQDNSDQLIDTQAESIISLTFDPGGTKLTASKGNQVIQSWELNGIKTNPQFNYQGWLVDLDYSPDETQIAAASQDEFATIVFDAVSGSEQQRLVWLDHASPILYGAIFSPDWDSLAWVTRGTIQLMDVKSEELGPMLGHEDFIVATDWSPKSDLIAAAAAGTVGEDYKPLITIWDPISGQSVTRLVHEAPLLQIAFSPDGSQLVSLDTNGNIYFWIVAED